MPPDSQRLMERAARFHGHRCGGLAIGVKACEALAEEWGLSLSEKMPGHTRNESIVCVAENDSCSIDAIQSILGCTIGSGTLILKDCGKQAFSFYGRESGKALRIYFSANMDDIPREKREALILSLSASELFSFSLPALPIPERARIFKNIKCPVCGERVSEGRIQNRNGIFLCSDCFAQCGKENL